ncbi:hypothetical protein EYF80_049927 [Liparis tanakae]|uniref:Uncharacterized protein n=1 Tax=Liparis tanakae TaxID=230148 RepID=A0A4Z2FG26_9TELE|nr:hypothetical protein EYF80_049927 [Liparis tanakae]
MKSHLRELSDVSIAARRNGDDAPAECRQNESSTRGSSRTERHPVPRVESLGQLSRHSHREESVKDTS